MFPNEDPIGKRILRGPQGQWTTVIGVVSDVTNDGATRESGPEYYIVRKPSEDFNYLNQAPSTGWRAAHVVARTGLDPGAAAGSIRAAIRSMDASLPVEVETMGQRLWEVDASPRFYAILLGVFAAIGVLIAAVGLFGVTSFLVAQRTREIGVRLALGATRGRIVRMVFGVVGLWTVAGVAIGSAGSFVTARAFRSLLFRVGPADPVAIGAAIAVLGFAAVIAAAAPARNASRIDPIHSLRQE
jgi:predicted lysophospholipase L1 biosynthesis ABC-type transport system permease subunit